LYCALKAYVVIPSIVCDDVVPTVTAFPPELIP
jgi:hypothetical protein